MTAEAAKSSCSPLRELACCYLGSLGAGPFGILAVTLRNRLVAKAGELDGGVQMALPPRSGLSLNSLGIGEDDQPNETSETQEPEGEVDTAEASDEQPKDGLAQPSETEKQIMSPATLGSSGLNAMAGSGAAGQGVIIPSVTAASSARCRRSLSRRRSPKHPSENCLKR